MIPANQHLRIAIGLFILLFNLPLHALEELGEFPPDLVGTWVYETGDEKLEGCNTFRIVVDPNVVRVFGFYPVSTDTLVKSFLSVFGITLARLRLGLYQRSM